MESFMKATLESLRGVEKEFITITMGTSTMEIGTMTKELEKGRLSSKMTGS